MKNALIDEKNAILKSQGSRLMSHPVKIPFREVVNVSNKFFDVVFSPDPLTGFPSNDLYLMNEGNVNSDVRQALEKMNRPIVNDTLGNSDDDVVLDTMQFKDETADSYISRMQELTEKDFENE